MTSIGTELTSVGFTLASNGWFAEPGAYVMVGGQYGSEGKGALAALIGTLFGDNINIFTTNAGPNSGHTGYTLEKKKIITRQLPLSALVNEEGLTPNQCIYLNAGAIIDLDILGEEIKEHDISGHNLNIHPTAAIIQKEDLNNADLNKIASTNKGTGPALARKIMRKERSTFGFVIPDECNHFSHVHDYDWYKDKVFVEVAQGFSLGLNDDRFYPYVTSRECTVMQAIADARIPHTKVKKTIACYRTYPIRVGNIPGSHSGDCYPDQKETTWGELGIEPEYTTVTKRMRRVFTWSRQQFRDSVRVNQPDALFINFINYMTKDEWEELLYTIREDYYDIMHGFPEVILGGLSPFIQDIKVIR